MYSLKDPQQRVLDIISVTDPLTTLKSAALEGMTPTISGARGTLENHLWEALQKQSPRPSQPEELWTALTDPEIAEASTAEAMSFYVEHLCCTEVIPSIFRHIIELTPSSTMHNNHPKSRSSAPLIASFLSCILTETHIPLPLLPGGPPRPYLLTFYAIVQLVCLRPSISPRIPVGLPEVDQIAGATEKNVITYTPEYTRYFVPIEEKPGWSTTTILAPKTPLKHRKWRGIRKEEAQECLRFPGSGIAIGDGHQGEMWHKMDGMEKLWCEKHGLFFELKAWVRDI